MTDRGLAEHMHDARGVGRRRAPQEQVHPQEGFLFPRAARERTCGLSLRNERPYTDAAELPLLGSLVAVGPDDGRRAGPAGRRQREDARQVRRAALGRYAEVDRDPVGVDEAGEDALAQNLIWLSPTSAAHDLDQSVLADERVRQTNVADAARVINRSV